MERIDASAHGRVEVAGRWFGVRGRRFVRPTLTFSHKGSEVRALAELEHKPWAAEDGEVWMAAFSVNERLEGAREIELSVAPDIAVELRRKGRKLARPGDTLAAGSGARLSRFKDAGPVAARDAQEEPDAAAKPAAKPTAEAATGAAGKAATRPATVPAPTSRRRPSASGELERLGARLASANHTLEQERERRAELAKTLEDERTANRQLRTELGQARSELEVAAAARVEAAAVEAELEDARRQLREAERRHKSDTQSLARRHEEATQSLTQRHEEATQSLTQRHEEATQSLARDHEQVTEAHAALQDELQEHAGALESTREALAAERAEAGRLRNRLAQLQETRQRGATPPGAVGAAGAARATDAPGAIEAAEPRVSRRATSRAAARSREADPTQTQPFDVMGLDDELELRSTPPPSRAAARRTAPPAPDPPYNPPVAERLRPVNPSLRHRTWWFGRLLALLVLIGVIAAVWMVLHSTVLH